MLAGLQSAASIPDSESRFRETAQAYLRFARERFALYSFLMSRIPETHGSGLAKAVWNLLLEAASGVSASQTTPALLLLPGPFCMATPSWSIPVASEHLVLNMDWSGDDSLPDQLSPKRRACSARTRVGSDRRLTQEAVIQR